MQIIGTHILMLMIFLGTSGQPSISSSSFLEMYPSIDPIDLEIEGLIVDATTTKAGRDFYDLFYTGWNPGEKFPQLSVIISERPLPGRGTQIIVTIEENVIFQRFLQPRYDDIKISSEIAMAVALQYMQNYEAFQQQLQGDDLSGTGIY